MTTADRKKQLQQLAAAVWPLHRLDPAVQVKRHMADMLIAAPKFRLHRRAIAQVGDKLGSSKKLGITSFEKLLAGDPSRCFILEPSGYATSIRLDAAALQRYADEVGGLRGCCGSSNCQVEQDSCSADARLGGFVAVHPAATK
jgi:hypothetical protein